MAEPTPKPIKLRLIRPIIGRPAITNIKKFPHGLKAENYVNILLLFIDYTNKRKLAKDCAKIVKQIYQTLPFGDSRYRDRINVFTPKEQLNLEAVYPDNKSGDDIQFKTSLKDVFRLTAYPNFILPGASNPWVTITPQMLRSKGCVGIVSGKVKPDFVGGGSFNRSNTKLKDWAKSKGAVKQAIDYFQVITSSAKYTSTPNDFHFTFTHELGHAFSLDDEYEDYIDPPDDKDNLTAEERSAGVFSWTALSTPNSVVKQSILWPKTNDRVSKNLDKKGALPVHEDIDYREVPWEVMIGEKKSSIYPAVGRQISRETCNSRLYLYRNNGSNIKYCVLAHRKNAEFDKALKHLGIKLPSSGNIGLHEGGSHFSFDIYRPDSSCRMDSDVRLQSNNKFKPFCAVCKERILYQIVDPDYENTILKFKKWLKGRY